MSWKRVCGTIAATVLAISPAVEASAQEFPKRPITLIVGLAAGGITDTTARIYADAVSAATGWKIVVENRAGSGGAVAASAVQSAAPDGHTLLVFSGSQHATVAATTPGVYQPVSGFAPITLLFNSVILLTVPGQSAARSVEQLFHIGRTRPGGLTFASQGIGSPPHLLAAKLALAAKVPVEFVHYRGGAPLIADLLGSRVDFAFPSLTTTATYLAAGQLRALAVDADRRLERLPDVPTLTERGFGKEKVASWFGLATTAGTPDDTVARLRTAFVAASSDPALVKRLTELGTPIVTSTSGEMGRLMKEESEKMQELVAVLGLRPQ